MKQTASVAALTTVLACMSFAQTKNEPPPRPKIFGGAQIEEIYRVVLDRNAFLLESIMDVIKQKDIQDGEVIVSSGSVQQCTYHYVSSTDLNSKDVFKTVKGPFEILNASGLIAGGEPHIHITLSGPEKGAFGGHLEKGCQILYLAELTFMKFSGTPLIRRNNQYKISILQPK